jgi:hypothetical protein
MFCSNCGHQNLEEARFCLKCGSSIEDADAKASIPPGAGDPPIEARGDSGSSGSESPAAREPHTPHESTPPPPHKSPGEPPPAEKRKGPNLGLILGCSCGAIALLCIVLVLGLFLYGKKFFEKNNLQAIFSPSPTPTQTSAGGEIFQPDARYVKATMCRSLEKGQKPGEATDTYSPHDKFYCSVELSDMDEEDRVTGKWYKGEEFLKEATVSITSRGANFAGFTLTPVSTWETGDDYCLEIYINDVIRGKRSFSVREDTSSSTDSDSHWRSFLKGTTLCKSVDEHYRPIDPTESFNKDEKFYCSIEVKDLPPGTKALGKWCKDSGLIDEKDVFMKDGGNGFISFSCTPEKEWPEGEYSIEIYFNNHLVETRKFTVSAVEE